MATTILQAGPNTPIATPEDVAQVAADIRYRIAEAAVRKTLPADCFPVTFTNDGVSYSVNSLVKESDASAAGDMYIAVSGTDYSLAMVESPATESELMSVVEVATFSAGGVFETSGFVDLQFGGVSPIADTSPTLADIKILADRAIQSVYVEAPEDGIRATVDFTLPERIEGKARDFMVKLTFGESSSDEGDISLSFVEPTPESGSAPAAIIDFGSVADVAIGKNLILFTELPAPAGVVDETHWLVTVKHEDFAA